MAEWSKMRAIWTAERDKHVKKGAVSGVSIGDAIEAVVKARSKGYSTLNTALDGLDKAVAKYKAKIAKEKPDLGKWMDKNLGGAVKETRSAVALDLDSMKWIETNMLTGSLLNIMAILPDEGLFSKAMALTQGPKAISWEAAVKAVGMFDIVEKYGLLLAKRAKTMKDTKWAAQLEGYDGAYKALIEFADIVVDDVKVTILWSQSKSSDEWGQNFKKMKSKQTAVDHMPLANRAMKQLAG